MSELYSTSIDTREPAAETDTSHEPAHDNAGTQNQDNAAIEAGLDEAELPTRAESRAATWGPDADDEDEEPDFGPESDHAVEASLDEADLPTRAESRAATWGPDATNEDGEHTTEERSGSELFTGNPHELVAADLHDACQASDALTTQASTDDHDQDAAENWPSQEDRARLHDLYQEYLKDAATDQEIGRDSGMNVVGDKPDRSPDDTSDLPPTGEQLAEMEGDKKSRFQDLWHEAEKEDALDGIHSELEADANTLHDWLAARPPGGHAEQPVPVSPWIGPQVADHAIDAGNAATACLALGFVMVELGRRIHDRLNHRKENVSARD